MRQKGGVLVMGIRSKLDKRERLKELNDHAKLTKHKCYKCEFSTWTGTKLFCIVPNCIRKQV